VQLQCQRFGGAGNIPGPSVLVQLKQKKREGKQLQGKES